MRMKLGNRSAAVLGALLVVLAGVLLLILPAAWFMREPALAAGSAAHRA